MIRPLIRVQYFFVDSAIVYSVFVPFSSLRHVTDISQPKLLPVLSVTLVCGNLSGAIMEWLFLMKPPEKITLYQLLKVCFFYSSCSLGSGEPNSNFLKDCLSIPWIWVCLFWTIKLERDLNDLLIMVPSTDNLILLPCFLHIYLYRSCTIWQCSLWPLFRFG